MQVASTLLAVSSGALLLACGAASQAPAELCSDAVDYGGAPLVPAVDALVHSAELGADVPEATHVALESALAYAQTRMDDVELSAAVVLADGGQWTHARSTSAGAPLRHWWASVGKAFTAMVVMQLVDEHKLGLEQTLSEFVPQVPNAEAITVRHLLSHTAGVYSFQNDPAFRARSGYVPPGELVAIANEHGPVFCPGLAWDYSNTGYVLLGQIIEAVEGEPYHRVVNRRIAQPLGESTLEAMAPGEVPGDVALPAPGPADTDVAGHDITTPFSAGVIVATPLDMIRAFRRFLAGEVVSEGALDTMFATLYPLYDSPIESYGLGVMVYDLRGVDAAEGDVWLGHSGGSAGVSAVVAWSRERRAFVAVALTGSGSPQATARLLLDALP